MFPEPVEVQAAKLTGQELINLYEVLVSADLEGSDIGVKVLAELRSRI